MSATAQPSKSRLMFLLLCIDLGMNSSIDYDNYVSSSRDFLIVLLAAQIVVQIFIFLVLFLTMADTFLFRVGLLGFLLKKFRLILILHPIYIAITVAAGAYRIRKLGDAYDLVGLWRDPLFNVLSILQKTCE